MVNTAELRQIFPLRGNTLRHVVEGDGRYPRAMTPSEQVIHHILWRCVKMNVIVLCYKYGYKTTPPDNL